MEGNETQIQSVNHGDWLTCQKSDQYLLAFRKKSLENCLIAEIYEVQGPLFRQKSMERNKTQSRSVNHSDWLTCQKSGQNRQAFRKKVRKNVWLLKFTKSKASNFAKNQWNVMKLKLDL